MAKPRILEDIDQLYNKIAEVIDEILPNQLMNKNTYDADNDGIVDKADAANTATNASNLKKSDGTTVDADTITTKLLKIPTYNGNTNQVLTSNGDGTASWKDAQGGDIGYDNAESGLTSTDVQGAIDEVNSHMKTGINDVKAQLTSGEHEFRFGITADGEYGYHKEVEGADTVVPFSKGVPKNFVEYPRQGASGTKTFNGKKGKPYYVIGATNQYACLVINGGTGLESFRKLASGTSSGQEGVAIWELIPSITGECSYNFDGSSTHQYAMMVEFEIG